MAKQRKKEIRMKTKMKTLKKAENSKTLQAMKLYLIALCSLDKISNEDIAALYKHIKFAENHPEILLMTDAQVEKEKKERGE